MEYANAIKPVYTDNNISEANLSVFNNHELVSHDIPPMNEDKPEF
jgi:hypothetical protein